MKDIAEKNGKKTNTGYVIRKRYKSGGAIVSRVVANSIADECGIEEGDTVIEVNRHFIEDIFDFRFQTAEEKLCMVVLKKNNELLELEIEKDMYEEIGLEFDDPLFNNTRSCSNKCIFCFIDQLPKGLRKTLYFKDDDTRLSFLSGNYVTLTNVGDKVLNKLIKYRMSPVNISVHTTDPDDRAFIMGNAKASGLNRQLRKLSEAGIEMNFQIVLMKGINDGHMLDKSINDLSAYYPYTKSISVVPVGLTCHREGLYKLRPFTAFEAVTVITQIEKWQSNFLEKLSSRMVYASDEFYIKAGIDLPDYRNYEDFPQLENGVGMMRLFVDEFEEAFNSSVVEGSDTAKFDEAFNSSVVVDSDTVEFDEAFNSSVVENIKIDENNKKLAIAIATGQLAEPFIKKLTQRIMERYKSLDIKTYGIINRFFGEYVTVSGLVTARDILEQLADKFYGTNINALLIPENMLNYEKSLFLDDVSLEELSVRLGTEVIPVPVNGKAFLEEIIRKYK